MAETTDFLGQVVSTVEHQMESLGDLAILSLMMIELDRARVHIAVDPLPGAHFGLESLELDTRQEQVLRTHHKVSALEALLGVRSHDGENGHSADTPLIWLLGALSHGNSHSSQALLDENTSCEARC